MDKPEFYSVDIASDDIFNYPFILITGHGNIDFSVSEAASQKNTVNREDFCMQTMITE